MKTNRLFVPLSSEPFEWFRSGKKRWELRRYGRQYTERNIFPGRRVQLRRGYGARDILFGTIQRVLVAEGIESFFRQVPFHEVIPIAHSEGEAVEIASRILTAGTNAVVIGFEVKIEPQAIPLAPKFFQKVQSGEKTTTIRQGHRRYPLGNAALVCSEKQIPIEILEVRHTRLSRLDESDAATDGYDDIRALLSDIESFYPDINSEDEITIISFRRI